MIEELIRRVFNPTERRMHKDIRRMLTQVPAQSKLALKLLKDTFHSDFDDSLVSLDQALQRHGLLETSQGLFEYASQSQTIANKKLIKLCQNASSEGNFICAAQRCKTLKSTQPNSIEITISLVRNLIWEGDIQAAQEELEAAHGHISHPALDILHCDIALAQGSAKRAIHQINELTMKHPDNLELKINKGKIYLQLQHFEEAEEYFKNLLLSHPNNTATMFCLAKTAFMMRAYDLAGSRFADLIKKAPNNLNAHLFHIKCLLEIYGADVAQAQLDQLEGKFEPSQLWMSQIIVLRMRRDDKKILNYIENIIQQNPIGTVPSNILETIYIQKIDALLRMNLDIESQERFELIHANFAEILKFRPMRLELKKLYCRILIAEDRIKEAQDLINLLPQSMDSLTVELHIWRLQNMGNLSAAKDIWDKHCHSIRIPQIQHSNPDALERLDDHAIDNGIGNVTLITVVKNDLPRIPWFLNYYRKMGIDRFVFIDNGSQDDSRTYLRAQSDVHLYHAHAPYYQGYAGVKWINQLSDQYASNGWVLYVDVDEALVFPRMETNTIKTLTRYMEENNQEALSGFMVDMFSNDIQEQDDADSPVDFMQNYRFFENSYQIIPAVLCPYKINFGGFRQHFGATENMTKTPLFRGGRNISLLYSSHSISPAAISDVTCGLLHYKFTNHLVDSFSMDIKENTRTGQCNSRHKRYLDYMVENDGVIPVNQRLVTKYQNSMQLVSLGLIECPSRFQEHIG
ncbi:MAG: glycosyltransferase family 2 protein [Amylibacter sp.]|nr:glycosyltransferase family 2 protein [Amylibacter sp.]